ncbi:MAG: 3-isopropylmalate dehydratase large subunit [Thermoplasmatota archaeon]|nr:3-isopropylmalate dehydratase large subunit [Candidatus Thermoplasmatota archaeon]MBU1915251.1 3-isopropylmalate dehydratase large subunit [Candidatus Thermoplasmatota archaeon]
MGKTIAEKVLSAKSGKDVHSGEIVEAEVDYVMVNDITGPAAFDEFEGLCAPILRKKVVLIPDHYVPNKDIASAKQAKKMRDFAKKHRIKNYFEVGCGGVCHQLMIEQGFVAPGRLIVGADSHTCSYGALGAFATGIGSTEAATVFARGVLWFKAPESMKFTIDGKLGKHVSGKDIILTIIGDIGVEGARYASMEVQGGSISSLPVSDRITISNMGIEAGAKACIVPPDKKVDEYLRGRVKGKYRSVLADEDAMYSAVREYDGSDIVPVVAKPYLPSNVAPASEVTVQIDQAYLGSCTNGRIEDLRIAARIMKGKKVHNGVRMIVVPATKEVFDLAIKEGLVKVFSDAGAFVSGPTCGACLGGYMGVLAPGERCVSSTNRNFVGRMGDKESEVYLASPAVVAASAIKGRIADPSEVAR